MVDIVIEQWDSDKSYTIGEFVRVGSYVYLAIQNSQGLYPYNVRNASLFNRYTTNTGQWLLR